MRRAIFTAVAVISPAIAYADGPLFPVPVPLPTQASTEPFG